MNTILALGFTSLFTDVGTEMIFPLLPAFLATLGAGPAFLGLLEGAADATAALLKLQSGRLADQQRRRKPFVVFGYGLASAIRPLVGLATLPWQVFAIRVTDRIGKGLRSSPRDLMIAEAAPEGQAGRAFGIHNAMDHAGALLGPVIATALLAAGVPLRTVFLGAFVPGLLAVFAVSFAKETAPQAPQAPPVGAKPAKIPLPPVLKRYLGVLAFFSLGNSSDILLILRAQDLGVKLSAVPLLWALLSLSKMLSAAYGGGLSDRVPRRRLIILGWLVFALTYLGFVLATEAWQAWALFAVYGAYHGLTEPVEKALVKDLAPEEARGRAYGLYNFWSGIMALVAGVLCGALWQSLGAGVALGFGAATALCSAIALPAYVFRK
ncbi:MAG: MFS transporter [Myxococcota bacterium]